MASIFARLAERGLPDYSPLYIIWRGANSPAAMPAIHRWTGTHFMFRYPSRLRWPASFSLLLIWPLRAMQLTLTHLGRFGKEVKEETGKSLVQQSGEQLWLALRYFIPSRAYYYYKLYMPSRRAKAQHYLLNHEIPTLFPLLNGQTTSEVVTNKLRFAEFFANKHLPTVPTLAICTDGEIRFLQESKDAGPQTDFILKPKAGSGGEGIMRWEYLKSGFYRSRHVQVPLPWSMVRKVLQKRARVTPYLLQPRLTDHPDLLDLTNGALATVRLVTLRTKEQEIEFLAAVLQMPVGKRVTNNLGIASPIDEKTGTLGKARSKRTLCHGFEYHPNTGSPIAGRKLPFWKQVIELALEAHRCLNGFASLGWDIAITASGPVLLETNSGWDVELIQGPHEMPLGETRFADFALAHIEQIELQKREQRQACSLPYLTQVKLTN